MPAMRYCSEHISRDTVVQIGKRRFLAGKQGEALSRFIEYLVCHAGKAESVHWLIPYRTQIRDCQRDEHRALLTYIATHTQNTSKGRLAIWLRANCGGSFGAARILRLYDNANDATKATIARTLKKMHAWSELSQIEHCATNSRIRNIAKPRPPKEFEERIQKFARNVDTSPIATRSGKLVIADDLDWGGGKPPKPVWRIREILQRIHLLVRGPNHAR